MRWLLYLLLYIPIQLFTYLITPLLPLFKVDAFGACDNNSYRQTQPRLPTWLSWFDTPDNSLLGDSRWMADHSGGYWSMVCWLYRNSLYGFKWSVLAAPSPEGWATLIEGPTNLDYHTKTCGVMWVTRGDGYWQYKSVKPFMGKILVLNFGWLLDDVSQKKALFMFSPRIKKG